MNQQLRLLHQKRELLQNLIQIQSTVNEASGVPNTTRYRPQSHPRSSDTYSMMSGSSGASYATFATSTARSVGKPMGSRPSNSRAIAVVPRLALG